MKNMQKGLLVCIKVLDVVRRRATEILQSDEAKALGRKIKSEAGKDKARITHTLQRKALRVVDECEKQLARVKSILGKKETKKRKK